MLTGRQAGRQAVLAKTIHSSFFHWIDNERKKKSTSVILAIEVFSKAFFFPVERGREREREREQKSQIHRFEKKE